MRSVFACACRASAAALATVACLVAAGLSAAPVADASPRIEIAVRVVDERGAPIERASVRYNPMTPEQFNATTDAAGQCKLSIDPALPTRIVINKPGFNTVDRPMPAPSGGVVPALEFAMVNKGTGGVIEGRVTDEAGNGIEGASVQVAHRGMPSFPQFKTLTGARGLYRFELPESEPAFLFSASAPGRAPQMREYPKPGTAEAPARADFALPPGHWVGIVVVDAEGKPLPRVRGKLNAGNIIGAGDRITGRRGVLGFANLPDDLQIDLSSAGLASILGHKLTLDTTQTIAMTQLQVFRAKVIDAATRLPVEEYVVGGFDFDKRVQKLPGGVFTLPDFDKSRPFHTQIYAAGHGFANLEIAPDAWVGAEIERTVALEGRLGRGVVMDARTGAPIAGAEVILNPLSSGYGNAFPFDGEYGGGFGMQRVVTNELGEFAVTEAASPGSFGVRAKGYATRVVASINRGDVSAPDGKGLILFLLEPEGVIDGFVRLDGRPLTGGRAVLTRRDGEITKTLELGPDAAFRFDGLPEGSYTLAATGPRDGFYFHRFVALAKGGTATLSMGDGLGPHKVWGTVTDAQGDPAGGVTVSLVAGSESIYPVIAGSTGVDGKFVISRVPPGDYEVRYKSNGEMGANKPGTEVDGAEKISVAGDLELNWRPAGLTRATARIAFDPAFPAPWRAALTETSIQPDWKRHDPTNTDWRMNVPLPRSPLRDGAVRYAGEIGNKYVISLWFSGQFPGCIYLPGEERVQKGQDNDLGDLVVPPMGYVRVKLEDRTGAGLVPRGVTAYLYARGGDRRFTLNYEAGVQVVDGHALIGFIPPGEYEMEMSADGFAIPRVVPIKVAAGVVNDHRVEFAPEGVLKGYIYAKPAVDPLNPTPVPWTDVKPDFLQLTGVGGTRVLTAQPAMNSDGSAFKPEAGQQFITGPFFQFGDLRAGFYKLRIEAAGYEPLELEYDIKPGYTESNPNQIFLTPLAK